MSAAKSPFTTHPHGVRWDNYIKSSNFHANYQPVMSPKIHPTSLQITF